MDEKERKVQNAIGSLNTYNVYMAVNFAAVNSYTIIIKAANEEEALERARALIESESNIDDSGKDYLDTCNTDYDPSSEFGDPELEVIEQL